MLPVHYYNFETSHFEKFSNFIGIAFQITDDILDVTSSSETLGKTARSDIHNKKSDLCQSFRIKKVTPTSRAENSKSR